jgi:hypothetical protein
VAVLFSSWIVKRNGSDDGACEKAFIRMQYMAGRHERAKLHIYSEALIYFYAIFHIMHKYLMMYNYAK